MKLDTEKLRSRFCWDGSEMISPAHRKYRLVETPEGVAIAGMTPMRTLDEWKVMVANACHFSHVAVDNADRQGFSQGELAIAAAMLLIGALGEIVPDPLNTRSQLLAVLELVARLAILGVPFDCEASTKRGNNDDDDDKTSGHQIKVVAMSAHDLPQGVRDALHSMLRGGPSGGVPPASSMN